MLCQNQRRSFIFLIAILSMLIACSGGGSSGDGNSGSIQQTLKLGETKTFNTIAVGVNGSLLTVDSPDPSMDGLGINIPPGSYDDETRFSISYAPITGHSGNTHLDPVTPLISVENGGKYADEVLTMKIPVTMEDGYHYMAFYYDEKTGALEGIPEVAHDETSLTIATRHFSKIMINRVGYEVFVADATVDSGFKVQQDNWQFENPGSYLSPGGICSGMSIASLWYYIEKKKKQGYPPLYALYDNGTSTLEIDDDQAIKLCSTIQWWEGNYNNLHYQYWYSQNKQKDDIWTYFMFIHSILLTGEPQYMSIFPDAGKIGHALVVYKKSGNALFLADPNAPEDKNAKIEFIWGSDDPMQDQSQLTGHFKPIDLKWNKDSDKINFTNINYIGKNALIDTEFEKLWNQLDSETVPWNQSEDPSLNNDYPNYELKIIEKDDSGTERESVLTDNYKTTNSTIKVKVETYDFDPRINVFYENIPGLNDNFSEIIEVQLKTGKNRLGFSIEAERYSDETEQKGWVWTDFKYVTIEREKSDSPKEASISVTNTLEKTVVVYIDGVNVKNGYLETGETWQQTYAPGTYLIEVSTAGVVSGGHVLKYSRQISLSDRQNFVYDFENTQDCNVAKVTIDNQSSFSPIVYKDEKYWLDSSTLGPNNQASTYLPVGKTYSLRAKAATWEGYCFKDCIYTCWEGPTFTLDCQGYTWTISGNGSTCP